MPYYFFIYFHLIIHIECCSYVAEILCMGFVPVFNRFLASLFDAIENVGIQFEAQKLAQKKNRRENNWAFLLSLGIVLSIVYLMLWQHPRRTTMCVCVFLFTCDFECKQHVVFGADMVYVYYASEERKENVCVSYVG